jgi:hypothetical protein
MTIALVAIGGALAGMALMAVLASAKQADLRDELSCAKAQSQRREEMYEEAASESRWKDNRIVALRGRVDVLARKLKHREEEAAS